LLQPVVVKPDMRLVCGRRRIEAFRKLGRTEIDAHIVEGLDDELRALLAECNENTCRKGFTRSEAVAVGKTIEKKVRAQAKERQAQAGPAEGKGRKRTASGKLPEAVKGRTRDKVASYVGMSPRNYEKAEAVVDAAATDPTLAPVVAEMDRTGNVDRAFKVVQAKKSAGQKVNGRKSAKKSPAATQPPAEARFPNAPAKRPKDTWIKRSLNGLSKEEGCSAFRSMVNAPTCLGLSSAGLDTVTLCLRRMHPELAPLVRILAESPNGPVAKRVPTLVQTVLSLSPGSRIELLDELRRDEAQGKGEPAKTG
jgi:ParB-like chromosome segregation protein Spo0J